MAGSRRSVGNAAFVYLRLSLIRALDPRSQQTIGATHSNGPEIYRTRDGLRPRTPYTCAPRIGCGCFPIHVESQLNGKPARIAIGTLTLACLRFGFVGFLPVSLVRGRCSLRNSLFLWFSFFVCSLSGAGPEHLIFSHTQRAVRVLLKAQLEVLAYSPNRCRRSGVREARFKRGIRRAHTFTLLYYFPRRNKKKGENFHCARCR